MNFSIRLGSFDGGEDYGTWSGNSPEEALLDCLRDIDRTRRFDVTLLSTSSTYGQAADTWTGNGNGGQDTDGWWYLTRDGEFVGVYQGKDRDHSSLDASPFSV